MVAFFDSTPVPRRLKAQLQGRFFALPNIVLDSAVVEEVVADGLEAGRLAEAALTLWRDPAARAAQQTAFAHMRALMAKGAPDAPRQRAVDRVLGLVGRGR
jgi:lipid A disaccharide synthetase